MRYVLEPLNEHQDMNCRVAFAGSRAAAAKKAAGIAAGLQSHLEGAKITCRVRTAGKETGLVALPDGTFVDEITGDSIKMGR